MEFSWQILVAVAVANLFWLGAIHVIQALDKSLPPRHSIVPETNQKFLYIQDFWTMKLGDPIGVTLIGTSFAHLVVNGCLGMWHWIAFVVLTSAVSAQFAKMCLSQDHKPDMGFPEIGKISWIGIIHLPYFGIGVGASVFCLWFIFTGDLRGPVLYVGLCGAAFYALCFAAEIKSGNFDPLKRI